jgi:L-arabonate dehydrase
MGNAVAPSRSGRAVVFDNIDDFHARINDENLDVDANCVLVLKNCGQGLPGMAELDNMPLPPKVLKKGDMVRISDARMSRHRLRHRGPAHYPEAADGPLAAVQNGDIIELDVAQRKLHLDNSDEELARRIEQLASTKVAVRADDALLSPS